MAYRLTLEESAQQGLARIVLEEVDLAIVELRVRDAAKRDECVHEARKSVKKIRAVIRLLMPGLGDAGVTANELLRDVGRSLSGMRDAAALLETLDFLENKFGADTALADLRKALLGKRSTSEEDPDVVSNRAVTALRRFRRNLNDWPREHDGFAAIENGLRATYRKGRRALRTAEAIPTAEHFHDLRKRVKDHWYHVRLLENIWADPSGAREKNLKELQEWLGDDHNLVILTEHAAGNDRVMAFIEAGQKELREKSLARGAQIYAEKTGDHIHRVKRWWLSSYLALA